MAGEMKEMAETAIGQAILSGDCKRFMDCLNSGEDAHFTDRKGNTYLHFIATMYRPYIFHRLLAAKVDINAQNKDGNTALHVTALADECCHVTDLMASGIDPFILNKEGKMAEELGTKSRYWNELYQKYWPGLRRAISDRQLERVSSLLHSWCSVEAVIYGKDMRQHAAALTFHDIVALIDRYRFSVMAVYAVFEGNYEKLRYALSRNECDPNFPQTVSGAHVHYMLQHAIKLNDRHLVAMLVDAGADVNKTVMLREYTKGPLYFSVLRSDDGFDKKITEKILSAPLEVNAKDEKGRSSLIYALDRTSGAQCLHLIEKLLDRGADISLRDDTGNTARDVAIINGRYDVRDILDKHLINIVKSSNIPRITQLAMDGYRDIFIEYEYRDTFIYAAGNETEDMTNFLTGLDKYWEDCEAFLSLCKAGDLTAVKALLQSQPNPRMCLHYKDKGGLTGLIHALQQGHHDLAAWMTSQYPDTLNTQNIQSLSQ